MSEKALSEIQIGYVRSLLDQFLSFVAWPCPHGKDKTTPWCRQVCGVDTLIEVARRWGDCLLMLGSPLFTYGLSNEVRKGRPLTPSNLLLKDLKTVPEYVHSIICIAVDHAEGEEIFRRDELNELRGEPPDRQKRERAARLVVDASQIEDILSNMLVMDGGTFQRFKDEMKRRVESLLSASSAQEPGVGDGSGSSPEYSAPISREMNQADAEISEVIARDRKETAEKKVLESQAHEQVELIAEVRRCIERMRSYPGPSGPCNTAEDDWVRLLSDLHAALSRARLLHLMRQLPKRSDARRFSLHLFELIHAGRKADAIAHLGSVAPLGKLDGSLAQEMTSHLGEDLLKLIPAPSWPNSIPGETASCQDHLPSGVMQGDFGPSAPKSVPAMALPSPFGAKGQPAADRPDELDDGEAAVEELLARLHELRNIARRGQYNPESPSPVAEALAKWRARTSQRLTGLRPVLGSSRDAVTEARDGKPVEMGYRIEASVVALVLKLTEEVLGALDDRFAVETASRIFCEKLEERLQVDFEQLRVTSAGDFAKARLRRGQSETAASEPNMRQSLDPFQMLALKCQEFITNSLVFLAGTLKEDGLRGLRKQLDDIGQLAQEVYRYGPGIGADLDELGEILQKLKAKCGELLSLRETSPSMPDETIRAIECGCNDLIGLRSRTISAIAGSGSPAERSQLGPQQGQIQSKHVGEERDLPKPYGIVGSQSQEKPPLQKLDAQSSSSTRRQRPCFDRDHAWLDWYNDDRAVTYHSPAKIRDKWNGMRSEDRKRICPTAFNPIEAGKRGANLVKKAIEAAKAD